LAANAQLSIDVRAADDGLSLVVFVAGEIDMATAPQLESCLNDHADRDVTVDLSGVTFVDSTGLAVLVTARRVLGDAGHSLRTTGEQDKIRMVLETTGLLGPLHGDH
jgi:anti-anti-sigma factor